MKPKVKINRLATGVPGLDDVLGGGLPEFSFNLIAGLPGCGKTTLAHQMMFALATPEQPALYLTVLGEPPLKMLRYQQQFEFFDLERVNGCIHFVNLGDDALAGNLDKVLERIEAEVHAHAPAFVFVDSFRSVAMKGATDGSLQQFMQKLGVLMTSWEATTFLIGEYAADTVTNPVFTVADGLIWLHQSVQRNSMVRKIEIMKMRGQPTLSGMHTFRIGDGGIEVIPPASALVAPASAVPHRPSTARASLGNAALDAMLGGGLPCGYSLLVAGPSGSGKSILAASFLQEGARHGEAGVIAVFEQRANRSHNAVLAELIASGRVGLVDSRGCRPVDRRDRPAAAEGSAAAACVAGGHRLAVGLRAGAGAHLPRGFPRVAAAAGQCPGPGGAHRPADVRAGGPLHRPAIQPAGHGLSHRRDRGAALHRSGQPAAARDGGREGAQQLAFGRIARLLHRRRRHSRRRDAAAAGGAAGRPPDAQAAAP
jgi:KaiC/GvpD/RAD55 family RecA-like ATPase